VLGFAPASYAGRHTLELIHPDDRRAVVAGFRESMLQPGIKPLPVFRHRTAAGDWRFLEVVATNCLDDPAIGGIVLNAHDVTDQTYLARALRTLTQANQVVVHGTDEASLLVDTCTAIVAAGYPLAWVGYAEHDGAQTVRPVASAGRTGYLEGIRVSWADDQLGSGPTGRAIRTNSAQVLDDMQRSPEFAPWRAAAGEWGLRASCVFPLVVSDETIGALSIYAGEVGAFDPASVAALRELAANLGHGIGRLRDAERLARSEELLREAQAITHVGHWQWDVIDGQMHWLADEMFSIHGIAPGQWNGTREALLDVVHPDDRASVERALERLVRGGGLDVEHRIVRPNGEIRYVHQRIAASHHDDPTRILGVCQDVTDARVAAMALERANEELSQKSAEARSSLERLRISDQQRRRLLGAMVRAQEAERGRVASDVHDDSIQMLAAAMIRLSSIRRGIADRALSARLEAFSSLLGRSIDSLRHLVFELRPPSLDRQGLEAAFRESLMAWAEEADVRFTVTDGLAVPPGSEERVVLFRIGQEALANVRKHARARSVAVSLEDVGEGILLCVADDGVGIDGGVSGSARASHFGVASMIERAELAGGWLRIDQPGRGTVVNAWIPVSPVPEPTP
jgi:signal transduction histidine kinase/putative methionine-R-sulfoxide reductase with GAF domain